MQEKSFAVTAKEILVINNKAVIIRFTDLESMASTHHKVV
jgi:hypothetical protein